MSEPSSPNDEARGSTLGPSRVPLSDEHRAAISASKKGKPIKKRALWKMEVRTCARDGCDNTFSPTYQPQRFCSRTCSLADRHLAHLEQLSERTQTLREIYDANPRQCPCGNALVYEDRHLATKMYCSPECRKQFSHAGRVRNPDNYITFECRTCGKEVTRRKKYGSGASMFCSNLCATRHTKAIQHHPTPDGVELDSWWEHLVYSVCKVAKIEVERVDRTKHGVVFDGHFYAPDFWLSLDDLYIEVKGRPNDEQEAKWAAFRDAGHRLLVIGPDEIMTLSPASLKKMVLSVV